MTEGLTCAGIKTYSVRPGMHSHNRLRCKRQEPARSRALNSARWLLLIIGTGALGYYGFAVADQDVYQSYENWVFSEEIGGNTATSFADYVQQVIPLFPKDHVGATAAKSKAPAPSEPSVSPRPAYGAVLGRLEVSRLHLSAMVREGVDAKVLSLAVGHVPFTALPGQPGNFAIAAHRDTLFRALKDIHLNDSITFQTPRGTYTYRVAGTKIVTPSDVSVLRSDGGGLIPGIDSHQGSDPPKLLTMITCYPFYYVGSAPRRFIVEARLVADQPQARLLAQNASPVPRAE